MGCNWHSVLTLRVAWCALPGVYKEAKRAYLTLAPATKQAIDAYVLASCAAALRVCCCAKLAIISLLRFWHDRGAVVFGCIN